MCIGAIVVLAGVSWAWWYGLRRDADDLDAAGARRIHRRFLIWGGLALPTVAIIAMLAFGIPVGHRLQAGLPLMGDALRIEVSARQWQWQVHYPGAGIVLHDVLHIPAGQAVQLDLRSDDVIHSFSVPRLAGKLDLIPGRVNRMRLRADAPGRYSGLCAEYCGIGHAHMAFTVEVHTADAFAAWLEKMRDDR